MRLELHKLKIQDLCFGKKTQIDNGVLTIDRDELQSLLEGDKRLARVDVALVRPGEICRILQVADVMEPRAKKESGVEDVLGAAGRHFATGEGATCVLEGAAVVICDYRKPGEDAASMDPRDHIIEMSGPGSEAGIYGKTLNVILLPQKKDSASIPDYHAALKIAGLKAARYLARAGRDIEPDSKEIYDLPALTELSRGFEGLPKMIYIAQVLSLQYEPAPGEPVLFSKQAEGIVPAIMHPNQILDGAVTSPIPGLNIQTYRIQNHPIIKELYKRHGQDLCFAGVIATVAHNNVADFERIANITASLAKGVIGADGAVLTKTGGGAPELAMACTARRCEQLGIKTAIAMLHMGADFKDAKYGGSTIFKMPEVDAIISMGFPFETLTLPPVDRVIGSPESETGGSAENGQLVYSLGSIYGTLCQMGSSKYTAVRY